jgi:hypothetical protein
VSQPPLGNAEHGGRNRRRYSSVINEDEKLLPRQPPRPAAAAIAREHLAVIASSRTVASPRIWPLRILAIVCANGKRSITDGSNRFRTPRVAVKNTARHGRAVSLVRSEFLQFSCRPQQRARTAQHHTNPNRT